MSVVRHEKVVASLPEAGLLTPSTLYYVRVGSGFDLYLTNSSGVAFPLNIGGGGVPYSSIVARSTSTMHNINNTSWTEVPVTSSIDAGSSADFQVSGNGIQCLFDGKVETVLQVMYAVSGARVNVMARVNHFDGVVYTPSVVIGASGYVRDASGHNQASVIAIDELPVAANDIITAETIREASSTATYLPDKGCTLMLRRLS